MPITVTPTLSTKTGYVEDIRDQVATLVRFIIMNPGRTSELWEDYLISFRKMSSELEHLREGFASRLANVVQTTLNNMFQDYSFSCEFTTKDYTEGVSDGRYTITFSIMMRRNGDFNQIPVLISGSILADTQTNELSLTYDQSLDTFTL